MRVLQSFIVLAALAGCSKSEPGQTSAPAPATQAPAAPAKPEAPAGPTVEDTTFKLSLAGQPEYTSGTQGTLQLTLEARGGYHVNQEYPIRIDLKAPDGVKLTKSSFERPDAKQFGEESARFELPFSATPGVHNVTASVDFAVCTKETCVPDQRTLALAVTVR